VLFGRGEVLRKYAVLEDCSRLDSLTTAWALGTLQRQSAHEQGKAVMSQIEDVTGLPPTAFEVPSWCNLRPTRSNEHRVLRQDGTTWLVDTSQEPVTAVCVLPRRALEHRWPLITHVIDRGSIGASSMYHMGSQGFLTIAFWDIFHGQWRSIKGVAKQIRWLWSSILQVLPVCNMNHGPFRSRMWRRSKEAFLDRWLSENTVDSPFFVGALPRLAAETGHDQNSAEGRQQIFDSLSYTPTFRQAGPVMKLMRWMSIGDCWEWHRPAIERHRFLLQEMAHHERGVQADDVQQAQGQLLGQNENDADDDDRDSPEAVVSKMKALSGGCDLTAKKTACPDTFYLFS